MMMHDPSIADYLALDFELDRNDFGQLVLTTNDEQVYIGVVPVRAFPIEAPDEGISLVSSDGHELIWIERLTMLPPRLRSLVLEELAQREFMPEIRRLLAVSSFATPSTWQIETDRGSTELTLKSEDDIRRLGRHHLLISDRHGVQFLIRDLNQLDRHSRKLLDRFF